MQAEPASASLAGIDTSPSSRIKIEKLIRKSPNATTTVAVGTINLGKYTLLIRFALLIRLLEASRNPVEKNVRQHAGENHQGIRRCSVRQQPGDAAKYHVKTIIVINGANDRPCADQRLLIAHRQIAPREYPEQLAIPPQIGPIVALIAARLDSDYFRHRALLLCRKANSTIGGPLSRVNIPRSVTDDPYGFLCSIFPSSKPRTRTRPRYGSRDVQSIRAAAAQNWAPTLNVRMF